MCNGTGQDRGCLRRLMGAIDWLSALLLAAAAFVCSGRGWKFALPSPFHLELRRLSRIWVWIAMTDQCCGLMQEQNQAGPRRRPRRKPATACLVPSLQPRLDCLKRRALNLDVAVERELVNGNAGPTLAHHNPSARLNSLGDRAFLPALAATQRTRHTPRSWQQSCSCRSERHSP